MKEKVPEEQLPDTQEDPGGSPQHQSNIEFALSDEDVERRDAPRSRDLERDIEVRIAEQLGGTLDPDEVPFVAARLATIVRQEYYSGPLPHPKHIEYFESVLTGSADRILSMAERQQEHNISMDKTSLDASVIDERRGMIWGGALFAGLILCAFISAILTKSATIPTVFLGAAVIGGIALFVNGRSK